MINKNIYKCIHKKNKMFKKKISAFSLVEISVVIIILMVMIAGLVQSSRLIVASRLSSARNLTSSSAMPWINYIVAWHDTTSIDAFLEEENNNGKKVSSWSGAEIRYNDRVNLVQDDDAKKPILTMNSLYGLPALKFDGIDDYLISKNPEQDVLSYRSGSIFLVFEPREVVSNKKNTIFIINQIAVLNLISDILLQAKEILEFPLAQVIVALLPRLQPHLILPLLMSA